MKTNGDQVRWYRNRIAHGPKFPGAEDRVPRAADLDDLLYWSKWADAAEGPREECLSRTIPRLDLITHMWGDFSAVTNELLARVIVQTRATFQRLPDHDKIALPDITGLALHADGGVPTSPQFEVVPSGVVTPSR